MGCPSIEALDAKGAVLRTLSLLAEGEANVQAQDKLGKPEDREERLCMRISELLLEAGDRGALRATEGTQHAVSALVQVTQILVDRVASLEGAAAAAAANNGAPIPGSPAEMDATMKAMFMDFAAKKFLGGTPPATPPTNGKA